MLRRGLCLCKNMRARVKKYNDKAIMIILGVYALYY